MRWTGSFPTCILSTGVHTYPIDMLLCVGWRLRQFDCFSRNSEPYSILQFSFDGVKSRILAKSMDSMLVCQNTLNDHSGILRKSCPKCTDTWPDTSRLPFSHHTPQSPAPCGIRCYPDALNCRPFAALRSFLDPKTPKLHAPTPCPTT